MAKCGMCMGRGSYDDPPRGIRVCVLCHGTGHDDPNVELWDRKGNVQHNAVELFGEARAQMKRIEQEHDAKSPFQREVEKFGQRECRHCGWLCMPNDAPAKTFYPLEPQAAQQQAEPGADERAAFEAWCAAWVPPGGGKTSTYVRDVAWKAWQARAAQSGQRAGEEFQSRVQPWMMACFGPEIAADTQERNHRFLEEALELVQACGATASEAHQLVDYVYGRPVGDKHQEIGGVMVTLAALCLAQGQNMHAAGETELARIWTKVEQIRAKQAAKPKHSPLPEHPVGQRAGVAEVVAGEEWYARLPNASALIHCWVRDVTAETVLLRDNDYTEGVRYLRSDVTFIERIAAAPTQQGDAK